MSIRVKHSHISNRVQLAEEPGSLIDLPIIRMGTSESIGDQRVTGNDRDTNSRRIPLIVNRSGLITVKKHMQLQNICRTFMLNQAKTSNFYSAESDK